MSEAENKTIARRFDEEVWGTGDQAALEELLDPNFVDHDALPGQASGREGHKQIVSAFRSAFPDLNVTTEDIVAVGENVFSRWTARSTHQGELLGIAPTGNRVTIKGIDVLRVAEDRIVERWAQSNDLEMMQQLGVVPPPEQSEEANPT
jgi:predicted ester cyclase